MARSELHRFKNLLVRDHGALVGVILVLAITGTVLLAPWLSPHDPYEVRPQMRLAPPGTPGYPLGADQVGRCILSRILWGGRISLRLMALPIAIASLVGGALGLLCGYRRGLVDELIMRGCDIMLAFPSMLVALAITAALGPGVEKAIMAIAITLIPMFARIVRGSVLQVREAGYVEAAIAAGVRPTRIVLRHILPNVLPVFIVLVSLETGRVLILSAGLSFLGLGPRPPTPDWGGMLAAGRHVIAVAPHVVTLPGLFVFSFCLGSNLIGDALRDMLDPTLRGIVR